MGKKSVRPFVLPPQRLSTGKSAPVLVRLLARGTWTRPLNARLNRYVQQCRFPGEGIEGQFKIEQQGSDLYFQFSVNGEIENFVLNDWRTIHSERSIYTLRALPWKLFQKIFQTLDSMITAQHFPDDDLFVNVYPFHMHPAPRGAHDLAYFPVFYWLVLEAWQHGKKVYKKNREFAATWRHTVRQNIENKLAESPAANELVSKSDHLVLDQLVSRFEKPRDKDRLVELQAALKDRRIPATAEELALDHAAHLCGVPLYEYTVRYLKKLKSNRARHKTNVVVDHSETSAIARNGYADDDYYGGFESGEDQ